METPGKSIRLKCLDCSAESAPEVRECKHTDCQLWPYRMRKGRPKLKTIRAYCRDNCMIGQSKEVELCTSRDCPLFDYRFGKHPTRKGTGRIPCFVKKSA